MIHPLQDELLLNEAAYMLAMKYRPSFFRLKEIYTLDLSHTKYYSFILKLAMKYRKSSEQWKKQIARLEDHPQLLTNVLIAMGEWQRKPWASLQGPKENLTELLVVGEGKQ